jgi:phosphoglycerol transferase MdoB-like AlkP superfamily enzyme
MLRAMLALPRTTFAVAVTLVALLILTGFRAWLYFQRRAELPELSLRERVRLFWVGVRLDAVVVSRGCVIVVLLTLFLPDALLPLAKPFLLAYVGFLYFMLFLAEIAGLYFFRYYDFRPNYLVFEHGADPEVLRAVRKAYPVVRICLLAAVGMCMALLLVTSVSSLIANQMIVSWYWDRCGVFVWLLFTGIATRGTLDHRPLNPSFAAVTTNRIANEVASCGIFNLLYEWSQRFKDEFTALKSVVKVPPADEAIARARSYLSAQGPLTDDSPNPLVRWVKGKERLEPLNVVLVVMESCTARLVGSLGGSPALSPELDHLATGGVLFERCYATGERTIQALEAAVSSFPPLPGAGVVKRPQARQSFATLASILKERGYSTLFLYGGQGIFDQMRAFFVANGFDRFIEEKDFVSPVFRGTWGVSDEDLFQRADLEFRKLNEQHRSFFATILTVSLHSPWEYPPGRIKPLPPETPVPPGFELEELNNFLYADYAIGKFIREAQNAPYFDKTLFVFVGDHGVHLRGRDLIPVDDYRVPALFLAPAYLEPQRVRRVISQIDIPPTIMGILGGEYRNPFFGNDTLNHKTDNSFAIVVYNMKRYGIVSERELIVLAETGEEISYQRDGSHALWQQVPLAAHGAERSKTALALLRLAEDLLVSGRYTVAKTSSG